MKLYLERYGRFSYILPSENQALKPFQKVGIFIDPVTSYQQAGIDLLQISAADLKAVRRRRRDVILDILNRGETLIPVVSQHVLGKQVVDLDETKPTVEDIQIDQSWKKHHASMILVLSDLSAKLGQSGFGFVPRGELQLRDVYKEVRNHFPDLCDDAVLCIYTCKHGTTSPEWQHRVRWALERAKRASDSVRKSPKLGYWQIR